jgi:PHP family Zn ribbon phosphoesterase
MAIKGTMCSNCGSKYWIRGIHGSFLVCANCGKEIPKKGVPKGKMIVASEKEVK